MERVAVTSQYIKWNTKKTPKWFSQQHLSPVLLQRSGQFPQHSFLFVTMATAPLYKVLPSPSLITLLSPELKQQKSNHHPSQSGETVQPLTNQLKSAWISRKYIWTLCFDCRTLWLCSENSTMVDLNERALLVFFLTSQVSCNFYWMLPPIISCQLFVFLNIFLCGDLNFAATKTEISLQGNL